MNERTEYPPPRVERIGNVTILTFTPDAIRDVEDVIARELGGLPERGDDRHLLLNFANVKYLNSMELGTLITLHKRVKTLGGRLTLFNLSPQVLKLFTTCRLETLLSICRVESEPTDLK